MMTRREAVVFSAVSGTMFCSMQMYMDYAEELLKRKVKEYELGNPSLQKTMKKLALPEFEVMMKNLQKEWL